MSFPFFRRRRPPNQLTLERASRRRRGHFWTRVFAISILLLCGIFALHWTGAVDFWITRLPSHYQARGWVATASSTVSRLERRLDYYEEQLNEALPFGDHLGTILKIAVCAVAAAVFVSGARGKHGCDESGQR